MESVSRVENIVLSFNVSLIVWLLRLSNKGWWIWFHSFIFHCGGRENLCENADVEVKYSISPNADPYKCVLHYLSLIHI